MKFESDVVNVAYCCSDLFAEVCAVGMTSLFKNNPHLSDICVYIIDDGISDINKERLIEIAAHYRRNILFVPMPNPEEFYDDNKFTVKALGHTYARMILGDLIPSDVERIISLDCDTLVLDKIDELWNIDMGDYPIAGVDDCMGRIALVKTQHLKETSVHCNAGMYLIDLKTWREENWTELFYSYIKSLFDSGKSLGGYEEEVITKVTEGRMMLLSPKFNLMTLEQVLSYKEILFFRGPLHYYTYAEIEEAKSHPVVTHATNFFYVEKRMFEENSDHPMHARYEQYRALTPWKNEPPMKYIMNYRQLFLKKIWHMVPRKISLILARFIRNEIRPLLKNKRDDE